MNFSRETQEQVYAYLESGLFSPKYVSPETSCLIGLTRLMGGCQMAQIVAGLGSDRSGGRGVPQHQQHRGAGDAGAHQDDG